MITNSKSVSMKSRKISFRIVSLIVAVAVAFSAAFFSIIGCLLCFVLSTEYLCELIIVLPSGILYFISALITVFGLKECFIMLNKEEKAECFRISRIILYTTTFIVYLYGRFFYK